METTLLPGRWSALSLNASFNLHQQELSTRRHVWNAAGLTNLKLVNLNLSTHSQRRRQQRRLCIVHATAASPLDFSAAAADMQSLSKEAATHTGWLGAFYRFTRPHTMIGTAIGIVSISLLALESPADLSLRYFAGLVQAIVPALLMNIYIVGLNQLFDVDIDKVNKPYLPLASGEYSTMTGICLVISSALLSLGTGLLVNSKPLIWALTVSLLLGTAYSVELPFLRWKKSAVAAASCILSVRAIVVQLAFFLHMQTFVLKKPPLFPKSLLFATAFMCFFSIVIALFKDIPDVQGDQTYGIRSFSVRLGQKKVFWLCIWLLQSAYAAAIVVGATSTLLWSKVAMVVLNLCSTFDLIDQMANFVVVNLLNYHQVLGHAIFAAVLWRTSVAVDLSSKAAISSFYMFIWKLFYSEYLLIPLMR